MRIVGLLEQLLSASPLGGRERVCLVGVVLESYPLVCRLDFLQVGTSRDAQRLVMSGHVVQTFQGILEIEKIPRVDVWNLGKT